MKRIAKLWVSLLMILSMIQIKPAFAAGLSITTSSSNATVGSTFKVKVSASGYVGKFSLSTSGNVTLSSTSFWLENSSKTVTATATAEGPATITVSTVDVSTSDANPQPVSISKSCSITCSNPVDTTLGDNSLKSLKVENATLSPKFKASTTTYTAEMPIGTTSATIKAVASQSKATVTGDGKKTVKEGKNDYSIVVTASNGSKKTYKVTIVVPKKPSVYVTIDDQQYGVIEDIGEEAIPKGFSKSTTMYDGNEISSLISESGAVTLVYLVDENNEYSLYLYDGSSFSKYVPITLDNREFVVMSLSDTTYMTASDLVIKDQTISGGYLFNDANMANYYMFHLLSLETGLDNIYLYETTEGTIQIYTKETQPEEATTTSSSTSLLTIILGIVCCILLISLIAFYFYFRRFKTKAFIAIKDYYNNFYKKKYNQSNKD